MSVSKLTWTLCRGIKIELNWEWESRLTWFQWHVKIWWFLCGGSNFTRSLCWWPQLPWFQCGGSNLTRSQGLDRNWLSFCEGVEKYLVLVSGSKLTCFLCRGIEISLISQSGSNWLDFSDGVEIQLICVGDRNWLRFSVGIKMDCVWAEIEFLLVWWLIGLVLVRVFQIDSVLGCGSQIAWFYGEHRMPLAFCVGGRNCFCFSAGDRSFVNEPKRSGLQIPVSADWVAQCFIRNKRTIEVRGSNLTEDFSRTFRLSGNASPHNSQALSKTHKRICRLPSYITSKMIWLR